MPPRHRTHASRLPASLPATLPAALPAALLSVLPGRVLDRRQWCAAAAALAAALPGLALAQAASSPSTATTPATTPATTSTDSPTYPAADPGRLALVIGNRDYPAPHNLPSIRKNAQDVHAALRQRGFSSTLVLDADPAAARQAVDHFVSLAQAAPADAMLLFYFSGHGLQLDAENLLLAAGMRPDGSADSLQKGSLALGRDVVQRLPRRAGGLNIAVVDACRSDFRPPARGQDGLNQVEAPPGCLIAFSTGAGKPAIAPNNDTESTFYTAALVRLLLGSPDDLSFSDLFRLVKIEVQRTMLEDARPVIKRFAQFPFIADNAAAVFALAPRNARPVVAPPRINREAEDRDWAALQTLVWPPDLLRLARQFRQRYPDSARNPAAEVAAEGAREAADILRRNDVRLYRSSFEPNPAFDAAYNNDLRKAARGDKDAAARVGRAWNTVDLAGPALSRYEGWMQFAAELGNGIASYELALHYRRQNQPQPAARWESRARELGYTPPASLEHYRK